MGSLRGLGPNSEVLGKMGEDVNLRMSRADVESETTEAWSR